MRHPVRLMLLVAVLLGGAVGCTEVPDVGESRPPVIVGFAQSATSTSARGTITLRITAEDPQGSPLRFSWEADTGVLGEAENTTTTSEVVWRAPTCMHGDVAAGVRVTVTNAQDQSASHPFTVSVTSTCTLSAVGGFSHSLAVRPDGTVWAWGNNTYGQLGDGTNTRRHTPVRVNGLSGVVAVAAGGGHSVAVRGDGTVWTWGNNMFGQLGDGTTTERWTPMQVRGLSGVVAVAAGGASSLAVREDGTAWAWGDNDTGQLGDGTSTRRWTPVQVNGLSDVVAVATGGTHSLAARKDGTVWAWGYN
ncbi:MAG TPA: RCC1 repeat-containing protein, partial [Archangium sp.]|nr:RCC1 repeat-containing protein [Archangium sp.]